MRKMNMAKKSQIILDRCSDIFFLCCLGLLFVLGEAEARTIKVEVEQNNSSNAEREQTFNIEDAPEANVSDFLSSNVVNYSQNGKVEGNISQDYENNHTLKLSFNDSDIEDNLNINSSLNGNLVSFVPGEPDDAEITLRQGANASSCTTGKNCFTNKGQVSVNKVDITGTLNLTSNVISNNSTFVGKGSRAKATVAQNNHSKTETDMNVNYKNRGRKRQIQVSNVGNNSSILVTAR